VRVPSVQATVLGLRDPQRPTAGYFWANICGIRLVTCGHHRAWPGHLRPTILAQSGCFRPSTTEARLHGAIPTTRVGHFRPKPGVWLATSGQPRRTDGHFRPTLGWFWPFPAKPQPAAERGTAQPGGRPTEPALPSHASRRRAGNGGLVSRQTLAMAALDTRARETGRVTNRFKVRQTSRATSAAPDIPNRPGGDRQF
jgi:hypothetical protein